LLNNVENDGLILPLMILIFMFAQAFACDGSLIAAVYSVLSLCIYKSNDALLFSVRKHMLSMHYLDTVVDAVSLCTLQVDCTIMLEVSEVEVTFFILK
jgi:hypothetical protein